ncbi:MAG: 1-acyl-sn-glycerol-3-phosphate acyltransferase [Clostridiales bacterium]|nr:1-acyl-sn-glycerol-3-phosphate acyltransferase [Clostridiales bacterium]
MEILRYILYVILAIIGIKIAGIIIYFLFTFAASMFINNKKEYDKESKFYRFLLQSTTGIGMHIMRIKYDLQGFEKIPDGRQMLFVCNHRSNYDPLISWRVLRKWHPTFISKASNFKVPFYGRMIRRCCFMTIDRENPRNAMMTIDRASKLLKADEVSIFVYPEGTRSKQCKLLPFHNGVFKIAQKADVPVVILTIQGTEKISKNYPWHSTKVRVKCVDVFSAEHIKGVKTSDVSDEARAIIAKDLEENPL